MAVEAASGLVMVVLQVFLGAVFGVNREPELDTA